jgi:hypothetical protein
MIWSGTGPDGCDRLGRAPPARLSGTNHTLFHMRDHEKLRAAFTNRDEGADRNAWLYSYNPLTVELS